MSHHTYSTLVELIAQGGHLLPDVDEEPHDGGGGYHTRKHKSRCARTQQRAVSAATEKQTTPRDSAATTAAAAPATATAATAPTVLPTPIIIMLISRLGQQLVLRARPHTLSQARVGHKSIQLFPLLHLLARSQGDVHMMD